MTGCGACNYNNVTKIFAVWYAPTESGVANTDEERSRSAVRLNASVTISEDVLDPPSVFLPEMHGYAVSRIIIHRDHGN